MGTSKNWLSAKARVDRQRAEDCIVRGLRLLSESERTHRGGRHGDHRDCERVADASPCMEHGMWQDVKVDANERREDADTRTFAELQAAVVEKLRAPLSKVRGELRDAMAGWGRGGMNPLALHREAAAAAAAQEDWQVWGAYYRMRRSIWNWEELAGLRRGSRAILEVVLELAREEGLPWYLMVPAAEVRRLARLCEKNYTECVRQLECTVVVRGGRVLRLNANHPGECGRGHGSAIPRWPGVLEGGEERPIAQWVVRYRRGTPWDKKRAAWWINYDLLSGTGRVPGCFVADALSLPLPYVHRNRGGMGSAESEVFGDEWLRRFEIAEAARGPLVACFGRRAMVWRGWSWNGDGGVHAEAGRSDA